MKWKILYARVCLRGRKTTVKHTLRKGCEECVDFLISLNFLGKEGWEEPTDSHLYFLLNSSAVKWNILCMSVKEHSLLCVHVYVYVRHCLIWKCWNCLFSWKVQYFRTLLTLFLLIKLKIHLVTCHPDSFLKTFEVCSYLRT